MHRIRMNAVVKDLSEPCSVCTVVVAQVSPSAAVAIGNRLHGGNQLFYIPPHLSYSSSSLQQCRAERCNLDVNGVSVHGVRRVIQLSSAYRPKLKNIRLF